MPSAPPVLVIEGRYELHAPFAGGGMASVHLGRLLGDGGFSRAVAIKRMLPALAKDREVVAMLVDEARLVSRIHHPNVVAILDVIQTQDEVLLVMDYVHGVALSALLSAANARGERAAPPVAASIVSGALRGLHAAHEATSASGQPLDIVHRDVSPQNILVGVDGVSRVLDFGVAKATVRLQTTRDGEVKGKLPYMAPEQLRGKPASRRTDVYAAAVVLWETLTARRLFDASNESELVASVLRGATPAPSSVTSDVPAAFDAVVAKGLARDVGRRYRTALEMAEAIESASPLASTSEVGAWVEKLASDTLDPRAEAVRQLERSRVSTVDAAVAGAAPPAVKPWISATRRMGALGVAGGVVCVAALIAVSRSGPMESPPDAPAATPSFTAATPSPPPTPVAPVESVVSVVSAEPRTTAAPSALTRPRRPPSPAPPARGKSDCDPPTYVDERGHVRYKEHCLH